MTTRKETQLKKELAEMKVKHDALLEKHRLSNRIIHNMVVANQSAWIEWQRGRGADHGMQWVHNGLLGPGMIPEASAEHGEDAQRWYDANVIN